jgi:hypothetical protein
MYISLWGRQSGWTGLGCGVAEPKDLASSPSPSEDGDDANPPANPSEGGVAVPEGLSKF